jgi:hypothetical protein
MVQLIIFSEVLIDESMTIPMHDERSMHWFGHSLGPWLRLLLTRRLVKVLLEYGLSSSGHAARDCRLGWFRDRSYGAIILLRLLL